MGSARRIEDEVAGLTSELETLDRQIAEAAQEISEASRAKLLPEAWLQAPGERGFYVVSLGWASARQSLADLVAAVGKQVDRAMAPLEDKPQPTRSERIRALVRTLLSLPRIRPREPQVTSLDQALLLADRLHALLVPRRERMAALRHKVESDLVELTGHRAMLAEAVIAAANQREQQATGVLVLVEHGLQAVQDLTSHLNRQLLEMNVAMNKLTIDSERAIVLKSVLGEAGSEPPSSGALDRARLPHLSALIDLNEADMLGSVELERRRLRTDGRFNEIFVAGGEAALSDSDDKAAAVQEVSHA
ncbi:MAG: hypothetical protein ACK4QP_08735 [Pseudorhizobium sp.]